MPLDFPKAIRCLINDLGTVFPALYNAEILFMTEASFALLEPFVPDKYFFGTLLFLSFGTLFRFRATFLSLYVIVL